MHAVDVKKNMVGKNKWPCMRTEQVVNPYDLVTLSYKINAQRAALKPVDEQPISGC